MDLQLRKLISTPRTTRRCPYCGEPYPMVTYRTEHYEVTVQGDSCVCVGFAEARSARAEAKRLREERERAARVERAIEAIGIPPRFSGVEPDFGLASRIDGDRGLYVVGDVGSGKTTLASAVAKAYVTRHPTATVRFTTMPDMLARIKDTYGNRGVESDVIDEYGSCALLVLDDLGKGSPTDWALERIFQLVNRRYELMLPSVITTQYSRAGLIRRLSSRGDEETAKAIVSRLKETTETLVLDGPDRRIS